MKPVENMRVVILAPAIFIYLFSFSQSQDTIKVDSPIFTSADKQPEFPGGPQKFDEYIKLYIRNLEMSIGRIVIEFVVETDGSLSRVHLLKGLCQKCDAEAIRVIQSSPKWIPGEQGGKRVRVRHSVTIIY
jgi:protein TonB